MHELFKLNEFKDRVFFPVFYLILILGGVFFSGTCTGQQKKNGFDLSYSRIPVDKIRSGGPPKDGIPALTDPKMVSAANVAYLKKDDLVIGIEIKGEARAYPLQILVHHENVNDTVGGVPVAVTY